MQARSALEVKGSMKRRPSRSQAGGVYADAGGDTSDAFDTEGEGRGRGISNASDTSAAAGDNEQCVNLFGGRLGELELTDGDSEVNCR